MLTFDSPTHTYRYNGVIVPSVTQVLSLVQDRQWFTEESAWRGSAVHLACQLDDEGDLDESTVLPEHRGYLEAWRKFRGEARFTSSSIEYQVYSGYGFAGTIDRTGIIGDSYRAVIDIKTGNPGRVCAIQTAAYASCLSMARTHCRFSVRLKPDGKYTVTEYPLSEYARDLNRFLACLAVYNLRAEFGVSN